MNAYLHRLNEVNLFAINEMLLVIACLSERTIANNLFRQQADKTKCLLERAATPPNF